MRLDRTLLVLYWDIYTVAALETQINYAVVTNSYTVITNTVQLTIQ